MNRSNNSTLKITTGAMIIAIFAMLLILLYVKIAEIHQASGQACPGSSDRE